MRVPFERVGHLVTVPVSVADVETRFVIDTGIGLTLVSTELCERIGSAPTGEVFRGRRMSGQEVAAPLARVDVLRFDELERRDFTVAALDFSEFPAELAEIGGFLSLSFFEERPFTVDYPAGCVVLETGETLAGRLRDGVAVPVELDRKGPSLDVFMPLTIPGAPSVSVEVDMGSEALILDERLATSAGLDLAAPEVRRETTGDALGAGFTRYHATLPGSIHPVGATELAQARPEVIFQRIIHDGLVGDAFLRRQAVTYDLARSRLIFGSAA